MQLSTLFVLACLLAVAVAAQYEYYPEGETYDAVYDTPVHDSSPRSKRGLILLKKKLLLGALGLKAAKVGAVGAGVVGALALKGKAGHHKHHEKIEIRTHSHGAVAHHGHNHHHIEHHPHSFVEVHDWSG